MVNGLAIFGLGFYWGGYESLILPAELSTLRSVTKWSKAQWLLRLQIGLEPVEKLKAEIEAGFKKYSFQLK